MAKSNDGFELEGLLDNPGLRRQMCALIRLLESDTIGESHNAAAALSRLLRENNIVLEKIMPLRAAAEAEIKAAAENGARLALSYTQPPRSEPRHARPLGASSACASRMLAADARDAITLADNERDFLLNVLDWTGPLSVRQQKWLDRLWARHARVCEASL